ncbi:MAG TPA: hypothetical protein VMA36_16545 [Candidatus Limnocylindria bacterium]|jgi:hypothetical protein|nr:hypothetical protein [Candidatus Limnocylindria bacterium]
MPPSADPRAEIVEAILAFERSCLAADAALVERRWPDFRAALASQRQLTGRLAELFAATPQFAPDGDPRVRQRLLGVFKYREDQLRRLRAYHEQVGTRLSTLAKMRAFRRSIGTAPVPARILNAHH